MAKHTDKTEPFSFAARHIGPRSADQRAMLALLKQKSLDQLTDTAVPDNIRSKAAMDLPAAMREEEAMETLRECMAKNQVMRSHIGLGYYDCITPPVIQRLLIENPGWYTSYTPYQAEISQGRLESLLNFQTMIIDLTGAEVANASVLDEATAAAEAMGVCGAVKGYDKPFFIAEDCFPQTIAVCKTRAEPRGTPVVVQDPQAFDFSAGVSGVLLQYPGRYGDVHDYEAIIAAVHKAGGYVVFAADILSLLLLKSPGEMGADFVVGQAQRFGVPMGYGGPHAGFLATSAEHVRRLPGRIVGVSKDTEGRPAVRLSLQTREQHIRRERATSNICTAQALLANVAAMYAVYHGPEGLKEIAKQVHARTSLLAAGVEQLGLTRENTSFFDTLTVRVEDAAKVHKRAHEAGLNLQSIDAKRVGIALDETSTDAHVLDVLRVLSGGDSKLTINDLRQKQASGLPKALERTSSFLTHQNFNSYHSETELMRYATRLERADLSLTTSMIPLGSCTMKLNAVSELAPISWPEVNRIHPFAPSNQTQGYQQLVNDMNAMLCAVTGFDAYSLQPNSGAQGEYAGLLTIRKFHQANGDQERTICLIPQSAHGTNPASAVMCGMKVVVVKCDSSGNIDLDDLRAKASKHASALAALMVTYPSTHGVFEESIKEICELIHEAGGQVYMDGANMNAMIGLCQPGKFGPDVCHLNLHKTFCIPHGGGGPGVGPIGVRQHLEPYLPSHPHLDPDVAAPVGPVAGAPYGSASILPISWMYMRMMGDEGLREATSVAILNANYMAKRLEPHYPILYRGRGDLVAHECIVDLRPLKKLAGVDVEDVAKRLMDYGFHAPTMAWPVPGTMMIEPTESESKAEIDRYCDAMIAIRQEIAAIESGQADRKDNPLKNAPHTATMLAGDWSHPYSRQEAFFPLPWVEERKYWPKVGRIDNAYGDRNLVCACPSIEEYSER